MKILTAGPPTASVIGTSGTKEGEFLPFQALKSTGCLRALARSSCALVWKGKNSRRHSPFRSRKPLWGGMVPFSCFVVSVRICWFIRNSVQRAVIMGGSIFVVANAYCHVGLYETPTNLLQSGEFHYSLWPETNFMLRPCRLYRLYFCL